MKVLVKTYLVKFNKYDIQSKTFVSEEVIEIEGDLDKKMYELYNLNEIYDDEGVNEGFKLGVMRLINESELNEYEFKVID